MHNKKENKERQREKNRKKSVGKSKKKNKSTRILLGSVSIVTSDVMTKIRVLYSEANYIPYQLNVRFTCPLGKKKFRIKYSTPSPFPEIFLKPPAVEKIPVILVCK